MKKLIALTNLLLCFLTLPVFAEVWDSPHKYYDKSKQKWVIYIPTSNGNVTKDREEELDLISNECSWLRFGQGRTEPITSIKIGMDETERLGTESTGTVPTCRKNKDGTYPPDNISVGTLVKSANSYHYKTSEKNEPMIVRVKRQVPVYRKGTQCGFILFGVSDKRKLTTFKVGGTKYNFADLTEVKHPRICYRGINDEWVTYTPDNY